MPACSIGRARPSAARTRAPPRARARGRHRPYARASTTSSRSRGGWTLSAPAIGDADLRLRRQLELDRKQHVRRRGMPLTRQFASSQRRENVFDVHGDALGRQAREMADTTTCTQSRWVSTYDDMARTGTSRFTEAGTGRDCLSDDALTTAYDSNGSIVREVTTLHGSRPGRSRARSRRPTPSALDARLVECHREVLDRREGQTTPASLRPPCRGGPMPAGLGLPPQPSSSCPAREDDTRASPSTAGWPRSRGRRASGYRRRRRPATPRATRCRGGDLTRTRGPLRPASASLRDCHPRLREGAVLPELLVRRERSSPLRLCAAAGFARPASCSSTTAARTARRLSSPIQTGVPRHSIASPATSATRMP